MSKLDLHY